MLRMIRIFTVQYCLTLKYVIFRLTRVHLYVVKNNLTDTEASIEDVEKEFLTSSEAFAVVSVDDAGTPSNNIKGLLILSYFVFQWRFKHR